MLACTNIQKRRQTVHLKLNMQTSLKFSIFSAQVKLVCFFLQRLVGWQLALLQFIPWKDGFFWGASQDGHFCKGLSKILVILVP